MQHIAIPIATISIAGTHSGAIKLFHINHHRNINDSKSFKYQRMNTVSGEPNCTLSIAESNEWNIQCCAAQR